MPKTKNRIISLLSRLIGKGFLKINKVGCRNRYTALISALIQRELISADDYEELKEYWKGGGGLLYLCNDVCLFDPNAILVKNIECSVNLVLACQHSPISTESQMENTRVCLCGRLPYFHTKASTPPVLLIFETV